MFAIFVAAVAIAIAASRWDGALYDRKGCVQVQEVQGQVLKVDTCKGETEAVDMPEGEDWEPQNFC